MYFKKLEWFNKDPAHTQIHITAIKHNHIWCITRGAIFNVAENLQVAVLFEKIFPKCVGFSEGKRNLKVKSKLFLLSIVFFVLHGLTLQSCFSNSQKKCCILSGLFNFFHLGKLSNVEATHKKFFKANLGSPRKEENLYEISDYIEQHVWRILLPAF